LALNLGIYKEKVKDVSYREEDYDFSLLVKSKRYFQNLIRKK